MNNRDQLVALLIVARSIALMVAVVIIALLLTNCATPKDVIRCRGTKMIGWATQKDMTEHDTRAYETAKSRCQHHFATLPCLAKFTKLGERRYHADCGKPK
jgi:hypothetical protein